MSIYTCVCVCVCVCVCASLLILHATICIHTIHEKIKTIKYLHPFLLDKRLFKL